MSTDGSTGPGSTLKTGAGSAPLSAGWPFLLLALGVLGVGVAGWRPVPAGVWHDDGVYMLVGKALADGHGLVYEGVVGAPPAAKFPPLYPLVLAGLWVVFGSIGPVTMAATFLGVGLLAAAAGLFARALRDAVGIPTSVAVAVSGLAFVSTDLLRTALVPLSEPLFVFLTALALSLWTRATGSGEEGDGEPSRAALWGLSAVLVATVLTRSAGLSVALAFAVSLALRRRFAVAAIAAGPALLVAWLWGRWATRAAEAIPEGARDLLGPYGSWWLDQAATSPGTFVRALPAHTLGVLDRAAAILIPGLAGTVPLRLAWIVLGPLAVYGTWRMVRRFPPLGWLTLGYLAMLLLWPYLDRRLVAPWLPMLLSALALGGRDLLARRPPALERVVNAVGIVWVVAYSAVTAYRLADGWPSAPYRLRADRLAAAVEAMGRTVPADAVVGAPEFWAALHLHGGWTVAPSVRFDPRSVDPEAPMWGTPDEQIALWRASGIEYLLLEQGGQLHGAALDRLEAECPGRVFVLARMNPALVVRIDWDATCDR